MIDPLGTEYGFDSSIVDVNVVFYHIDRIIETLDNRRRIWYKHHNDGVPTGADTGFFYYTGLGNKNRRYVHHRDLLLIKAIGKNKNWALLHAKHDDYCVRVYCRKVLRDGDRSIH